jgi:hypothetical protein
LLVIEFDWNSMVNLNLFKEQINRSYDGHAKDVAYMFLTKCNQK